MNCGGSVVQPKWKIRSIPNFPESETLGDTPDRQRLGYTLLIATFSTALR